MLIVYHSPEGQEQTLRHVQLKLRNTIYQLSYHFFMKCTQDTMIQTSPLGEPCSQLHALDTLVQGTDTGKEAGS